VQSSVHNVDRSNTPPVHCSCPIPHRCEYGQTPASAQSHLNQNIQDHHAISEQTRRSPFGCRRWLARQGPCCPIGRWHRKLHIRGREESFVGADESTGLVKQSMAKYHLRLPQGAPKQRPFASATAIRCRQSSLSGRPRPLDTNEYLCVYKSYKRKRERGRIRVAWLAMQ